MPCGCLNSADRQPHANLGRLRFVRLPTNAYSATRLYSDYTHSCSTSSTGHIGALRLRLRQCWQGGQLLLRVWLLDGQPPAAQETVGQGCFRMLTPSHCNQPGAARQIMCALWNRRSTCWLVASRCASAADPNAQMDKLPTVYVWHICHLLPWECARPAF